MLDRSGCVYAQRRIMPGADKGWHAVLRFKLCVEESDEAVRRNVFGKIAVDSADCFRDRVIRRRLPVHGCVQAGHQKRCGSSLSRHVAQSYYQSPVISLYEIIIVAADFVTRKAYALKLVASDLR